MGLIAFEKIAGTAREPQVSLVICPAFRPWNNVFDFQRPGDVRLMGETIAATVRGGGPHLCPQHLG